MSVISEKRFFKSCLKLILSSGFVKDHPNRYYDIQFQIQKYQRRANEAGVHFLTKPIIDYGLKHQYIKHFIRKRSNQDFINGVATYPETLEFICAPHFEFTAKFEFVYKKQIKQMLEL